MPSRRSARKLVLDPVENTHFSLFLPTLDGGGAERVFVQLANELANCGYRADMVLAERRGPYLDELSSRVNLIDLQASSVVKSIPRLRRYFSRAKPQVVLSGLDHANVAAIIAATIATNRPRCAISMRSVPSVVYRETKSIKSWLTLTMSKVFYRFADSVIANSEAVGSDAVHVFSVPRARLSVIYNPLVIAEIDELSRVGAPHPWFAKPSPPVLLAVGRLDHLKDYRTLIQAFAKARVSSECRLIILGEGPERAALETLVRNLGLQASVLMPGFVKNPYTWMRNSALVANSSLTEGCPNAILQALACNTPVVCTDCPGGSAELLQNGRWGKLVPVGDSEAMAEAIVSTLESPDHPNGRERAVDFSHDKIVDRYIRVLTHAKPAATEAP